MPPRRPRPHSLSTRLHGLEAVFSPLASNLAHPRELEDQPQFAEAVSLLQDPDVPLDTVMQYALGANWTLACAALAALKRRADRSERVDEVVAQFDKLYPWPIYFALEYLLAVEPRPPVGDPRGRRQGLVGRQSDRAAAVPRLLRERERLGDAPVFGSALSATYASPPAQIRAFLERVNHPLAAALIRQLDNVAARQRRSHLSRLLRPLLGRPEGHRAADRARDVAGGAGGGRGRVAADARRARCW